MEITSYYFNEHTSLLELYSGNLLAYTITCDSEPTDEYIDNLIKEL